MDMLRQCAQRLLLRGSGQLAAASAASASNSLNAFPRAYSAHPMMAAPTLPPLPPCDFTPPVYDGPSKAEVLGLRKQFLSPGDQELASAAGHCQPPPCRLLPP